MSWMSRKPWRSTSLCSLTAERVRGDEGAAECGQVLVIARGECYRGVSMVLPRWRWTCLTESSMGGRVAVRAATSGSMTSMSSPSIFLRLEDELGDEGVGDGGGVEVGSALEAVGGVGVEEVAAGAATDGSGIEPGGLDEDVFGLGGDHGVPAAHDSGEGEGFLFVGYDEVVGFEGALGSVEELELFAFVGEADDDASFDLVEVEGVGRVAHAEEDEVACIYGVEICFWPRA